MGRVSRYKKVKSCDPYSKRNNGNIDLSTVGVWGLGDNGRRVKKKSLTVQRMQAAKHKSKLQKLQRSSNKIGGNKLKMKMKQKFDKNNNNGFDLPPDNLVDEFDMADLVGSVKRQTLPDQDDEKNASTSIQPSKKTMMTTSQQSNEPSTSLPKTNVENVGTTATTIPKPHEDDEAKVTKLLKLEQQIESQRKRQQQESYKRMDGESKRAFNKRAKLETHQIIHQTSVKKNVEKLQKKKEFLKNKKKNKRKKGASIGYGNNNDNDDDNYDNNDNGDSSFVPGERAVQVSAATARLNNSNNNDNPVRFGEQAERPPTFKQLPRGAVDKKKHVDGGGSSRERMTPAQIHAEQDAMELIRRRVQAQYAAIKSKRRQARDFHL